jgi:8-oxo-dGTP pyrophosphatase MutT (NUDIX family)
MKKDTLTLEKAKRTPAGGVLVGKREGQTIIHDKGTEGGYFVGKLHKEGGIKGINKSTGQPIEVQGGEVIITAPAVADQTKREFEGEMLTNREILSKINERGGGVSLENGGEIYYNGSSYNYGGSTMTDYEIMQEISKCGCEHDYKKGGKLKKSKKSDVLNLGTSGVTLGAVTSQLTDAVGGFDASNGSGTMASIPLENPTFNSGGGLPKRFWGNLAGGVLIYCSSTERYLLLLRSEYVLEPNTWGIVSGKLDEGEDSIEEAVTREVEEETGQKITKLIPSYIFKAPNFTFHNYVSIVEEEFVPILNWENSNYMWVKLEDFPEKLHFGVKILTEQEDLNALVQRESADLEFLSEITEKFNDGGEIKEVVEYIEIWSAGSSLSNLYGRKYENYKDLKKDLEEINPRYSYIYLAPNGRSMGSSIDVKKDGKNTVKTINPTTSKAKDFEKVIKRSWGDWRFVKYDLSKWLQDDGKRKRNSKPQPQPEPNPKKEIANKIFFDVYLDNNIVKSDNNHYIFGFKKSLDNAFNEFGNKGNVRVKIFLTNNDGKNVLATENIYLDNSNYDIFNFNVLSFNDSDFERLFANIFPLDNLDGVSEFDPPLAFSQQELDMIFKGGKPEPQPEPKKEEVKIDFEATRKYLTLRIADLTKELNFKKPTLSNEEIGFYQRDINELIYKLRINNERELDVLPIKDRLENAYSLKWGNINAEFQPSKDLLAPNGLPTKLTDEEWVNVRSPYFSSFFGDWRLANEIGDFSGVSKVIDPETKEPMPVYHGTNVLFTEWKTYKTNNAHYFAKEREFSQWFAEQWSKGRGDVSAKDSNLLKALNPNKGEYLYRCFLDIKNPIDFSRFGVEKRPVSDFLMFLQINYNIGDFDFWTNFRLFNNLAQDTLVYSWMIIRNWQSFTEYIKMATTYDGYIFYEYHPEKVGTGLDGASLSYCAFDSSQIKFTTATEFNALITDSRFEQGGKL